MKAYYVYMVRCADGKFYVGISNDPERRIAQHNLGHDPESYTFTRRPVELVHCSDFKEVDDAIRWEKQLKGWSRAKKIALIAGDWKTIVRLSNEKKSVLRQAQDDTASSSAPARSAALSERSESKGQGDTASSSAPARSAALSERSESKGQDDTASSSAPARAAQP